jgi:hypothetical protein
MEESESDRFHTELDKRLQHVSEHLFYEIGGNDPIKRELIITAGGNPEYFSLAEELIGQAPRLKDWEFFALKPALPRGTNIRLMVSDVLFDNREIWFQPFRRPAAANSLELGIFIKLPEEVEDQELIAEGIFKMLYLTLGERSATLDIQTVEIALVDEEPDERGVKPLQDLPDFIDYFNRERRGMR